MPSTSPAPNARTESITLSKSTRSIELNWTICLLQVDIFINYRDAALLSLVDVGIYFVVDGNNHSRDLIRNIRITCKKMATFTWVELLEWEYIASPVD